MIEDTFYETLGVSQQATKAEIKTAYRTLSKKFHPDLNKQFGSDEIFMEIQKAYETLGNDEKRKEYDKTLFSDGNDEQEEYEEEEPEDWDYYEYNSSTNTGTYYKTTPTKKGISYYVETIKDKISDLPFINTLRVIVWFLILISPINEFLKTNDINNLALYYVGCFLFFAFGKIILVIINFLFLVMVIVTFFNGEGIMAVQMLGFMFVISLVGIFLLGDK